METQQEDRIDMCVASNKVHTLCGPSQEWKLTECPNRNSKICSARRTSQFAGFLLCSFTLHHPEMSVMATVLVMPLVVSQNVVEEVTFRVELVELECVQAPEVQDSGGRACGRLLVLWRSGDSDWLKGFTMAPRCYELWQIEFLGWRLARTRTDTTCVADSTSASCWMCGA